MRYKLFFSMIFLSVFVGAGIFADEIFVTKPVKKQSNSAIKEKIVHNSKKAMREFNNFIRTLSLQHDYLIAQIEDMAESQNFFAQADNKELAACAHHLEELCASLEKTRLEIEHTMKQAFKSRKK